MVKIRKIGRVFTALALASAGLVATGQAANAGGFWYAYYGKGGHAVYHDTNNHGWVCDDLADGHTIYAEWKFHGALGPTWYKAVAPAHNHGCKNNYFSKTPIYFQVCVSKPGLDECEKGQDIPS